METDGPSPSPLWYQALDKYREELQGAKDFRDIQTVRSLGELIGSLTSIQATTPGRFSGLMSLSRLRSRLKFVDDFSTLLTLCFGADATLTAAVWGSIRIILSHASSTAETLQDVLDMLEELSLTLPRFQLYEHILPLTRPLQQALVDFYCEIICFYARSIYFLRGTPHMAQRKDAWPTYRRDFTRTIMRTKRISSTVEGEADAAWIMNDRLRHKAKAHGRECVRYNNLPFPVNSKFSGREHALDEIHKKLDPEVVSTSVRSMALFGLGGVGKSQIAVRYAQRCQEHFDVILWVSADNVITIGQSFRTIAEGLGLLRTGAETQDSAAALWKVKDWLSATRSRWLMIFDNADDLAALKMALPATVVGSVLLTTRDLAVANTLAGHHLHIEAFSSEDASNLLLNALQVDKSSASDCQHALAISQTFGGFPLALAQISSFIAQRKMSLRDFLPLYERYSAKIDARKSTSIDYEHTLSTVWGISFEKLSDTSTRLLGLVSFFDPDGISEEILLRGSHNISGDNFSFLSDELDFGDATEELLRTALVNREGTSAVLTIHRLVQSAARKRLNADQSTEFFNAAVDVLCWAFPDHAKVDIGHQISTWERCEKGLPHVRQLVQIKKSDGKTLHGHQSYSGLLLRCSWYLYDREMYILAGEMVEQALLTFTGKTTLDYASATDLRGLIYLDMAQPHDALKLFEEAHQIRRALLGESDPFIAYSLNNIALAPTEMPDKLDKALEVHQSAISLRLRANSDRIGNSYSNMASLLLRLGRADEAEEMLGRCPSLRDFTDDTFLSTGNPRFSGDMVLLSRIRLAQGRPTEAIRLATKALAFRRELLGNRLKTCDSQYDVASMLVGDGQVGAASQLLEEVVGILETILEGQGQCARALYRLSGIYAGRGLQAGSDDCKQKAIELLLKLRTENKPESEYKESQFAELCPWMLW